ncbi:hypothetical protein [Klebsiella pneumoniae]|uniref:hypothetical protein n=1 Tax=Klebsiella pneumoniae TaxID=573 RepID=UPI000F125446|nr:hypothetical protein [Klebsiella pneumoniae]VCV93718.1 hypothetical protein BANRA_05743 [Klebsiella pneumoniae]
MKEDIEQAVLEMIKKSASLACELEHHRCLIQHGIRAYIECSIIPLKKGRHVGVGVVRKDAENARYCSKAYALVAFIVPSLEAGIGPVAFGARYDDKIIFSNCYQMESENP